MLICRGPMGAGMEEIYQITSALKHLRFGKQVAVLTDARFSGVSTGACIGHVGPEALAGGPIGKVRDGDTIRIVVDRNKLEGTVDLIGEVDDTGSDGRLPCDAERRTTLWHDAPRRDPTGSAERGSSRAFTAEEGAQILARRQPRPDLAADPRLPADTRLWAVLQQVSGGTWGGCVFDVDAIVEAVRTRGSR